MAKDVAPGSDLRQWFGHPNKWAISGSDTFANCVPILKVTVCPQSGQGSGLIGFQIATVSLEDFEFKMKRGLQISGSNQCSR
jgi:hypothetical protein